MKSAQIHPLKNAKSPFFDLGHDDLVQYEGGPFVIQKPSLFFNGAVWFGTDANFTADSFLFDAMLNVIKQFGQGQYDFNVRDNTTVDYSLSNAAIQIDMLAVQSTGHGGFAEGDSILEISNITGSGFDDVIRGSNVVGTSPIIVINGVNHPFENTFFITGDPGLNVLVGGGGSDVLEGRSGADVLVGGTFTNDSDFDYASYESSPAAVTVRLKGIGTDTQTAIATGGDAAGDVLVGIEGLIGSKFDDHLTGNALNNILAGGLGNDVLDGKGGIAWVDYSRDHFFDSGDTADEVEVHLGLNGANGTGGEFKAIPGTNGQAFNQVSVDTLISIENVTGTAGADELSGNEQNNVLDGRGGNDLLDGGFGDDTLIGGGGINAVSYASHDSTGTSSLFGETNTISLGLNGADGSYVRTEFAGISGPVVAEQDILRGIRNVLGSNRSETINGNEQNNVLEGRGGNDIIDGGLGDDTIIGDDGTDTVSYVSHDNLATPGVTVTLGAGTADGSATATFFVNPVFITEHDILRGIENVTGSNQNDTITGNELANVLNGRDGNDTLAGLGGSDTINGGAGNDTYDFRGAGLGTDRFFDDSGTDRVLVDSFSNIVSAQQDGNDLVVTMTNGTFRVVDHFNGHQIENIVANGVSMVLAAGLTGGNSPGIIAAGNGSETLDGRGGDDFLFGGNGSDRLIGGDGDDRLTGGNGKDTFVFGPGFGHDTIMDFTPADRIEFDGGVFELFQGVVAASQQVGADTVITLDPNNSITLKGVDLHSLHASNFSFG